MLSQELIIWFLRQKWGIKFRNIYHNFLKIILFLHNLGIFRLVSLISKSIFLHFLDQLICSASFLTFLFYLFEIWLIYWLLVAMIWGTSCSSNIFERRTVIWMFKYLDLILQFDYLIDELFFFFQKFCLHLRNMFSQSLILF